MRNELVVDELVLVGDGFERVGLGCGGLGVDCSGLVEDGGIRDDRSLSLRKEQDLRLTLLHRHRDELDLDPRVRMLCISLI